MARSTQPACAPPAARRPPVAQGGGWTACGSNTYPTGAFPACRSALGVYDLNGNAAEHMNLPLDESQMASRGSQTLGYTEMKGSWFIFDTYRAHEDWCRWRAPYWHGSRVMDTHSHANYHLGFRCCKTFARGGGPGGGGRRQGSMAQGEGRRGGKSSRSDRGWRLPVVGHSKTHAMAVVGVARAVHCRQRLDRRIDAAVPAVDRHPAGLAP